MVLLGAVAYGDQLEAAVGRGGLDGELGAVDDAVVAVAVIGHAVGQRGDHGDGTHAGVVGDGGEGVDIGCEEGGVGLVLRHGDGTCGVGVAVVPLHEAVVVVGHGADLHLGEVVHSGGAADATHGAVFSLHGDGVLVDFEEGLEGGVLRNLEGVRHLSAAAFPVVEVVAVVGHGLDGHVGEVGMLAAALHGAVVGGSVTGDHREGVGYEVCHGIGGLGDGDDVVGVDFVADGPVMEEVAVVRLGHEGGRRAALGGELDAGGGSHGGRSAVDDGVRSALDGTHGQAGADLLALVELGRGGDVIAVDAEDGLGHRVGGDGERQGREGREEGLGSGDEVVAVGDAVGGVGHAVGVHPVGHVVQLGGVGLDGQRGAVVHAVGVFGQLGDAGGGAAAGVDMELDNVLCLEQTLSRGRSKFRIADVKGGIVANGINGLVGVDFSDGALHSTTPFTGDIADA